MAENSYVGETLRRVAEELINEYGMNILVYENIGNLKNPIHRTFGLKNHKKENANQIMFQFLQLEERIVVGTILQIEGTRDLWEVTDTEDQIIGGVFNKFEAKVIKRSEKT
jgi:hypothetical protein